MFLEDSQECLLPPWKRNGFSVAVRPHPPRDILVLTSECAADDATPGQFDGVGIGSGNEYCEWGSDPNPDPALKMASTSSANLCGSGGGGWFTLSGPISPNRLSERVVFRAVRYRIRVI